MRGVSGKRRSFSFPHHPPRIAPGARAPRPEGRAGGWTRLPLALECARCLKPFAGSLDLPDYALLIPLEGEEAAPVVNEAVALTPFLREDSLLALPIHPVCGETCEGLPARSQPERAGVSGAEAPAAASPWAALAKLKLD